MPRRRPRRNPPLAPQEAADVLCAQLGRAPLFSEDDVHAFVNYCVAALQACPEDARGLVLAEWERSQETVEGRNHAFMHQGFGLLDGKVGVLSAPHLSPRQHTLVNESHRRARVNLVGAHEALQRSDRRRLGAYDGSFASIVENVVSARDNTETHDAFYAEMHLLTTPKDVLLWCKQNEKFVHEIAQRRALASGAYNEMVVAEYASGVVKLLGIADELESAGWAPEYLSLRGYGRLCTWLYDADGPWGTNEPPKPLGPGPAQPPRARRGRPVPRCTLAPCAFVTV